MARTFLIKDGDWVEDRATGRPHWIEGPAKTRQDLGEMLSISVQRNGWGTGLFELVGTVPDSPLTVAFTTMERVRASVEVWRALQQRQRPIYANNEFVAELSDNQAVVDQANPTTVYFRVAVKTIAGQTIDRNGTIVTGR